MELKLYFSDCGWQGSTTIVAKSWEEALEIAKPEYSSDLTLDQFKSIFEEHEIKSGLMLICLGDQ